MQKLIKPIQHKVMERLEALFKPFVDDFDVSYTVGTGVRGDYIDKEMTQVNIEFEHRDYRYEFYLNYDQLEYYIYKKEYAIARCNLEDYADMDTVMVKYFEYLERDISKFNIPTGKDQF